MVIFTHTIHKSKSILSAVNFVCSHTRRCWCSQSSYRKIQRKGQRNKTSTFNRHNMVKLILRTHNCFTILRIFSLTRKLKKAQNSKMEDFIQETQADPASGQPVSDLSASLFICVRQVMAEYAAECSVICCMSDVLWLLLCILPLLLLCIMNCSVHRTLLPLVLLGS